jgi:hypothetical protein
MFYCDWKRTEHNSFLVSLCYLEELLQLQYCEIRRHNDKQIHVAQQIALFSEKLKAHLASF